MLLLTIAGNLMSLFILALEPYRSPLLSSLVIAFSLVFALVYWLARSQHVSLAVQITLVLLLGGVLAGIHWSRHPAAVVPYALLVPLFAAVFLTLRRYLVWTLVTLASVTLLDLIRPQALLLTSNLFFIALAATFLGCVVAARESMERFEQRQHAASERFVALGTLAAGMGHEINNPLTYMLTSAQTLRNNRDKLSNEEVQELLDDLVDGTLRIRDIVLQLRTFSRGESTPVGPTDVKAVLAQTLRLVDNELRHRARVRVALDDIPAVIASTTPLSQVFLNLLINAAHAIPEGNAAAHTVRIDYQALDPDWVAISVHDSGSGIRAEDLEHVFEPFFTTKKDKGTGLGLSVSRQVVRSFGGELEVKSEPGHTVFTVKLRAAKAEAVPLLTTPASVHLVPHAEPQASRPL